MLGIRWNCTTAGAGSTPGSEESRSHPGWATVGRSLVAVILMLSESATTSIVPPSVNCRSTHINLILINCAHVRDRTLKMPVQIKTGCSVNGIGRTLNLWCIHHLVRLIGAKGHAEKFNALAHPYNCRVSAPFQGF